MFRELSAHDREPVRTALFALQNTHEICGVDKSIGPCVNYVPQSYTADSYLSAWADMDTNKQTQPQVNMPLRPKFLWRDKSIPKSVHSYIDAFSGEIDFYSDSAYPYQGPPSKRFKQIKPKLVDNAPASNEQPIGKWALKSDRAPNSLTADLLAAAEALGGKPDAGGLSSMGAADSNWLQIQLVDGGVFVHVTLSEHPTTNRVSANQRTRVRGSRCYRLLLELLGFDQPPIKLPGEVTVPKIEEIVDQVSDLLIATASQYGL